MHLLAHVSITTNLDTTNLSKKQLTEAFVLVDEFAETNSVWVRVSPANACGGEHIIKQAMDELATMQS